MQKAQAQKESGKELMIVWDGVAHRGYEPTPEWYGPMQVANKR